MPFCAAQLINNGSDPGNICNFNNERPTVREQNCVCPPHPIALTLSLWLQWTGVLGFGGCKINYDAPDLKVSGCKVTASSMAPSYLQGGALG